MPSPAALVSVGVVTRASRRTVAALRLAGAVAVVAALATGVALGVHEAAPGGRDVVAPGSAPRVQVETAPSRNPAATTSRPALPIVRDHIEFGAARLAATAAYSLHHYGERTATLHPSMVVLHFSESDDHASVRAHFAANEPSLGEAPGVCAHYIVAQDGTVHEVVPPTIRCRHTVGLNHVAIGVEFVQGSHGRGARWAAEQILRRPAQVRSGSMLVASLQNRFGIADAAVIGHAMANDSNAFRDRRGWRNDHVDWAEPEVRAFRRLLRQR